MFPVLLAKAAEGGIRDLCKVEDLVVKTRVAHYCGGFKSGQTVLFILVRLPILSYTMAKSTPSSASKSFEFSWHITMYIPESLCTARISIVGVGAEVFALLLNT
jgi:hypothetical protein